MYQVQQIGMRRSEAETILYKLCFASGFRAAPSVGRSLSAAPLVGRVKEDQIGDGLNRHHSLV